ncbi:TIGR03086 family metal-binding protein [Paractinoplanes maris]|uniref:TIGR03086 family metal-binding protein n=1 Tax=Paractinoplanes maris TaxID=1734446 RepID=UPI0020200D8C|nr:TIGR03086 family metal-binding protein [Actinoplanes maris]
MLIETMDVRAADATTVRATISLVRSVSGADLERPTPCAGWNLRELLAHLTAQHRGFAAAASGHGAGPEPWREDPLAPDPVGAYRAAADEVIAAFGPEDVLDREFALAGIGTVPGRLAIGFHLVDYVAHGWDVARALGAAWTLPDDVLSAALPVAEMVPDDESRSAPGAAFAARQPYAGNDPLDRILALLGRSPTWPGVSDDRARSDR